MPAMQGWHFLTLWDSGAKTCQFNLKVYDVLYLYISTPLSDAGCSKHSDKLFYCPPTMPNARPWAMASKSVSILTLAM